MAAYRRVDDLQSPAGRLPVYWDQLRSQRSVTSTGSLFTDRVSGKLKQSVASVRPSVCLSVRLFPLLSLEPTDL